MDNLDFFIKLNEICEDYLAENRKNLYIQNLNIYANKAKELLNCIEVENINEKEEQIDLLEGINLICEYLNELNPELSKQFLTQFSNGQLEMNYTDEDIYLEKKKEGNWCTNHVQSYKTENEINKDEIQIHRIPLSLIDIDNRKTTLSLLPTIVHEFFHSMIAIDKNKKSETYAAKAFAEMISIYFEFDFINKMLQKGYRKKDFLKAYYNRYNDTTDKEKLEFFLDQTTIIYKKIKEGILDESSYKTGNITCKKEHFDKLCKKAQFFLEKEEKKQKIIAEFRYLKEKPKPLFTAHKGAPYIIGAPLAYYLSCSKDPLMPQKMIAFAEEINSLPLSTSLKKIDLTFSTINKLNYTKIMENMRHKIILINKNSNDYEKKSFVKIIDK